MFFCCAVLPSCSARCLSQYTAIIVLYTCNIGCIALSLSREYFPNFLAQLPVIISRCTSIYI